MTGGFGRSYGRLPVVARAGGALVPVPGATVRLYLPGTTTPYSGALYPSADSLAPITFPTTADAGGPLDRWGDAPIRLDAEVSSAAYGTQRETLDLELPPDATDVTDDRYVNVT